MDFNKLNPFRGIIETKFSPHARTLRTSFWEKLMDTFGVLAGTAITDIENKNFHAGLFDYLTLGINQGLFRVIVKLLESKLSMRAKIPLIIVLGIPTALLIFARLLSAAVVTLAVLPVILGVHLVAKLAGRQLWQEVCKMTVEEKSVDGGSTATIGAYLNEKKISKTDIRNADLFSLTDMTVTVNENFKFIPDINEKTVTQKNAFRAFLMLNIGNFAGMFENTSERAEIKQYEKRITTLKKAG